MGALLIDCDHPDEVRNETEKDETEDDYQKSYFVLVGIHLYVSREITDACLVGKLLSGLDVSFITLLISRIVLVGYGFSHHILL